MSLWLQKEYLNPKKKIAIPYVSSLVFCFFFFLYFLKGIWPCSTKLPVLGWPQTDHMLSDWLILSQCKLSPAIFQDDTEMKDLAWIFFLIKHRLTTNQLWPLPRVLWRGWADSLTTVQRDSPGHIKQRKRESLADSLHMAELRKSKGVRSVLGCVLYLWITNEDTFWQQHCLEMGVLDGQVDKDELYSSYFFCDVKVLI